MQSIYRCTELSKARQNDDHACHKIASVQFYSICENYQVPEPWRGDIETAPLLFVSSNPSIDPTDDSPWETDSDEKIEKCYRQGFDVKQFPRIAHPKNGSFTRVAFWSSIKYRASELFGADKDLLTPGQHFAITEIVHCKSRAEIGVKEASATCREKHLANVLAKSGALVICALGEHARKALKGLADMEMELTTAAGAPILIHLPHPNARKERTVEKNLDQHLLQQVRQALARAPLGDCGHNPDDRSTSSQT